MQTKTREQFDAMNDAEFDAFWTAEMERVQETASTEDEVDAVSVAWAKAQADRAA